MSTHAYVFADIPGFAQTCVGDIRLKGQSGAFRYSSEWLSLPNAFPLDPVNLPLSEKTFQITNTHGVFGVFRDAGPDDWGTRIMLLSHKSKPANELERLIRTSGTGVGCLRFSLSRKAFKPAPPLSDFSMLEMLSQAVEQACDSSDLPSETLALLEPGSSLGGARPKITLNKDGDPWLLKFSRSGDLVDVPKLEYLSMTFLRERIGLTIPRVNAITLPNGKTVFAIKRFDGTTTQKRHFISAHSLFNVHRARLIKDSRKNPYSYVRLASILRSHSGAFEKEAHELFKRMIVNILIRNTDDHARNHALLYSPETNAWSLAPAYDVLPTIGYTQAQTQSLGVGLEGASSTIDNALSCAQFFGLKTIEAAEVVEKTRAAMLDFFPFCEEGGLSANDLTLLAQTLGPDLATR